MPDCTLCELPVDGHGVSDDDVEGQFCCRGCLDVYRTLGDVDTETLREERRSERASDPPEDAETTHLSVEGMHCSTCELYLEATASDQAGVHTAEASYATETVRVVYDPEETTTDALADALSGMGYRARHRDEDDIEGPGAASRLLVGGIFGMMAMTWYALFLYPTYFGFDPIVELGTFDGAYLYGQLAIVTAIILLYTGRPVLRGAYVSLRTGRPNVDLLVTVAATAAYLYSTARLLTGGTDLYYDVTIVVVLAVTVGTHYESRIKHRTAGLLADLTELQVSEATRVDGESVPVADIEAGDRLAVDPGERIPVDGTVREGTAAVDEALVTGESLPTTKRPGDEVRGGTVVTDTPLVVEAGERAESTLDRVVELLWDVQATRPGAQRIADRLAVVFVPLVLVISAVVGVGLLLSGAPLQSAMLTALVVLIVSCPCALGLATPLAVASGLQSAADRGVVVTTPALFEHGNDVETVAFDKTGTLTDGEMAVREVTTTADGPAAGDATGERGSSEQTLLGLAAAVERHSSHPIAEAVVAEASDRGVDGPDGRAGAATDGGGQTLDPSDSGGQTLDPSGGEFSPEPGTDHGGTVASFEQYTRGVAATVAGQRVVVGHPDLVREEHTLGPAVERAVERARERGDVPVVVGRENRAEGVIAVGDTPRSGWEAVVERVGDGREVVVLTGDEGAAADRLREHPDIDTVFAGVPPDAKAETVRRLAATGTVAMVGDGSNDAPALAAADVGIALESGTKLATDAADAVVLGDRIDRVPAVFSVAGGTARRIRENLAWAFAYNGVAIPLAALGHINPLLAALAMASSSLLVVTNSARDPLPDEE
jgi:Cu2+-exporting ATPase